MYARILALEFPLANNAGGSFFLNFGTLASYAPSKSRALPREIGHERPTPLVTSSRLPGNVNLHLFEHWFESLPAPYPYKTSVPESLMRRAFTNCAVSVLVLSLAAPLWAHHLKKGETATLPVTTTSSRARSLYEEGVADYENLYLERCNDDWRAAVKEDP